MILALPSWLFPVRTSASLLQPEALEQRITCCRAEASGESEGNRMKPNAFKSIPRRPAVRPGLLYIDAKAAAAIPSLRSRAPDPGDFVGWAYRCLQKPSSSARGASVLHRTLMLREFQEPDDACATTTLWDKLFCSKSRVRRNVRSANAWSSTDS